MPGLPCCGRLGRGSNVDDVVLSTLALDVPTRLLEVPVVGSAAVVPERRVSVFAV